MFWQISVASYILANVVLLSAGKSADWIFGRHRPSCTHGYRHSLSKVCTSLMVRLKSHPKVAKQNGGAKSPLS